MNLYSSAMASLVLCIALLMSCSSETPTSSTTDQKLETIQAKGGGGGSTPNPAIVYSAGVLQKVNTGTYKYYIKVMDADGQNQTSLLEVDGGAEPCWSNTGSVICYRSANSNSTVGSIKKFTLGASTNGTPVAGTVSTVYTWSASDSITVSGHKWSSSASEIVFTTTQINQSIAQADRVSTVYVVSSSGGTPEEIYSSTDDTFSRPTWSPDGSSIAVVTRNKSTAVASIKILNRNSPPEVLVDYPGEGPNNIGYGMEWSRSGSNTLAFFMRPNSSSPFAVYVQDASETSFSPTLAFELPSNTYTIGGGPSWSPDNSKIVIGWGGIKVITLSSGVLTTLAANTTSGFASQPHWKP